MERMAAGKAQRSIAQRESGCRCTECTVAVEVLDRVAMFELSWQEVAKSA